VNKLLFSRTHRMENFFVRYREKSILDGAGWLYSKEHTVQGAALCDACGSRIMALPFSPRHFHVLAFEYLFVDGCSRILLVNKSTQGISEVGQASGEVRLLKVSRDEKWCVMITDSEMLLFDGYLDLKTSLDIKLDSLAGVEWTDYDVFAVLTEQRILFYDTDLKLVGKSKDDRYSGVSWRSKYNTFACAASDSVRFIEPNGLEHGDPLPEVCGSLMFMENQDLLVATQMAEGRRLLGVFYMKNFHWYRKCSGEVSGDLLCVEGNTILVRSGRELNRLYVFGERTRCGPEYFVIDGASVLYTDFSRQIIPPPFYLTRTSFSEAVVDVSAFNGRCVVLLRTELVLFKIELGHFKKISAVKLEEEYDAVTLFEEHVVLKKDCRLEVVSLTGGGRCVPTLRESSDVVRCFNIGGEAYEVTADGRICHNDEEVYSGLDLRTSFDIERCDGRIIVHNGSRLHIPGEEIHENVTSFTTDGKNLAMTTNEACLFRFDGQRSSCYVDPGFKLLCIASSRVIGETRHGTLETFMPKISMLSLIRSHLERQEYSRAAEACASNGLSFDVFLESPVNLRAMLSSCRHAHLVSFFNCALSLGDFRLVLQDEELKRYRRVFSRKLAVDEKYGRNDFRRLIEADETTIRQSREELLSLSGHAGPSSLKAYGRFRDLIEDMFECLDGRTNLNFVVYVLVKLKRTDLALLASRDSLRESVGYMMTITTVEDILRSCMVLFDREMMLIACEVCQRDSSDYAAFFDANEGEMLRFKICDYLGDRADALYFLSRLQLHDAEREYVRRHDLLDEALMYEACGMSTRPPGFYYEMGAESAGPHEKLVLYRLAGNREKALETCMENLFWREAVEISGDIKEKLVEMLVARRRFHEAGQLIEEYIGDRDRAFEKYILCRSMSDAHRLCTDPELLKEESRRHLREALLELEDMRQGLRKYTERLGAIEERVEDYTSETSFSYTQRSRRSRATKLRDRPGGRYEREFVLDRIRGIVLDVMGWEDRTSALGKIFKEYGMADCLSAYNEALGSAREVLKAEIERAFDPKRISQLYDPNRPVVEKPDLGRWA
jgi:elongator complex protein 1